MNLTGGEEEGEVGVDPQQNEQVQTVLESVPEETNPDEDNDFGLSNSRADTRLSLRIPSQMSRATMVRTPARPYTQEEKRVEELEEDQVLITELKQTEYRGEEAQDKEEADVLILYSDEEDEEEDEEEKERVTTDREEDYDTDLELEGPEYDIHDTTGRSSYKKICQQFGIVPISYFVRHIQEPEIVMRYHGLGPVAAKALALVLRDSITLEKLNLNGNWIEGEGGEAMSRMLQENDYISELHLSDNRLKTVGAKAICKMLDVNEGLRMLDLSENGFEDCDAQTFADMLENSKYLKHLSLSRNRFGEISGEILGPAIAQNDILYTLDLSWNHFRQKGAVAVARGLKENVRLKTCSLAWNGFGAEGGAAIADALITNSSIQEIDISGNRLTADSALRIAKAITMNDDLRVLKMGNNLLTTSGAIALARAINETESSEMELLDLTDVPVEYEFLKICENIKLSKPNFKVIHGPILRSGNTREDLGKPGIDPFKKEDPVVVLQEHIVVNDLRLVDILRKHDPDQSLCVTPEDFLSALDELALPYDKPKVEAAVEKLAKEQSGRIFFGDFVKQQQQQKQKEEGVQDSGTS